MMKRTFWFVVGAGSTLWTQRKLKQKVDEITPASVAAEAARTAGKVSRNVARRVGDAVTEGRTQAELERRLLADELAPDRRR